MEVDMELISGIIIWLCVIAFFLIVEALFAKIVEQCRVIVEENPGRSFWIGLVNTIFFSALIALFFFLAGRIEQPLIAVPSVILFMIFIIGSIFGFSAVIQVIGDRIFTEFSGFRKKSYSAGLIMLGCLTPYIGWFGLLPYILIVSFGAFAFRTFTYHRKRKALRKKS
jgi:hypothetical protein